MAKKIEHKSKKHATKPRRTPPTAPRVKKTTAPRRVMVIVHGGGDFPEDYYEPLVAKIEAELGKPFDYLPLYYADVPKAHVGVAAAPASPAEAKFQADLERELRRSFEAALAVQESAGRAVGITATPIEAFACIAEEVAQYFFDPDIRARIQARLITRLDQAMRQYDEIVLNTLSLGTVVSFDTLKRLANQYEISIWFTCGSPLAKLRRIGVYDASLGAITAQNVARWHNVYDDTDYVGDPLGPAFPSPGYRLHDIFVNVGSGLMGSHDYWNNAETIKMLADAMR